MAVSASLASSLGADEGGALPVSADTGRGEAGARGDGDGQPLPGTPEVAAAVGDAQGDGDQGGDAAAVERWVMCPGGAAVVVKVGARLAASVQGTGTFPVIQCAKGQNGGRVMSQCGMRELAHMLHGLW